MGRLARFPQARLEMDTLVVADHFASFATGGVWTDVSADTGATVAGTDAVGGVVALTTGATDNNEALLKTTQELFKFDPDKDISGLFRVQFAEAATDDANVAVGFADGPDTDFLADDGAGDAINASGAIIFKLDGETVWRCATKNNSVTTETQSTTTAGGSAYQLLEIRVTRRDSASVWVSFLCNNVPLRDSNNIDIKHAVATASATEMDCRAYNKAGGANSEVLNVDLIIADQLAF